MHAAVATLPACDDLTPRPRVSGCAAAMATEVVSDTLRTQATALLASMVLAIEAEVIA
jgi:hypothetical protein